MNAWQDIAAIALVAIAAGFVAWRAWLALAARRTTGCGSGCGKCSADQPRVMQIDTVGQVSNLPNAVQVSNLPHKNP
jgi:hypothetical protein